MYSRVSSIGKAAFLFIVGNVLGFFGVSFFSEAGIPSWPQGVHGPLSGAQCDPQKTEEEIFFISCGGIY